MNFRITNLILCAIIFSSCHQAQRQTENRKIEATDDQIAKWKNEIAQVEEEFAKMVADSGIHDAFVHFAADSAVLQRNNQLIKGKDNIDYAYQDIHSKGLSWKADFVDVANSGDMAYSYGKFVFSAKDSLGLEQKDTGVFHTVWKRQSDGSWKFVWD